MKPTFNEVIGALITVISLLVVALAAMKGSAEAMTALVGVVGAATGYFLRGRIKEPSP